MQELDSYINNARNLPPAPRILPRLLLLLGQPNIDTGLVVNLLMHDPGLTANVLKLCNSAYFGSATPAETLEEAIQRLGFREVYRLVAALSGARALSASQKGYGLEAGQLWKHSVTAALAAQLLARNRMADEAMIFTATLLHDIGKVVLSEVLESRYTQLVMEIETQEIPVLDAEKILLGVQHAEIGGRLLHRWKFPPPLVAGVWYHHDPAETQHSEVAAFVYFGNMIAHFLGHGYGHQAFAFETHAEALEILNLEAGEISR
ncbi:MAG: HDOD domain-containing protein, partial [Verrucomicrobiota bacterium]